MKRLEGLAIDPSRRVLVSAGLDLAAMLDVVCCSSADRGARGSDGRG